MGTSVKVGALLTATVLASGVYYASTAVAGGAANTPGVHSTNATNTPPRVFAVVNSDGTKVRGKGVASSVALSPGTYDVRFLRNITKCAWSGTVGFGKAPFGGSAPASVINVSGRAGTNNGLFVQIFSTAGVPTNQPFLVVVTCS
jgi:hypothetical protein